jgi:TonB family protein
MNNFIAYIIKAGIALTVLYMFYWLVLRKDTHFYLNRVILITSALVSLVLPFFHPGILNISPVLSHLPTLSFENVQGGTGISPVTDASPVDGNPVNYRKIIFIIYVTGAMIVFARLIYQAIFLHAVSRLSKKTEYNGYTIISMTTDMTPFSYFNRIFIPTVRLDESSFDSIIAHEKSHLSQGHYIDLFIVEIMTILQWFNPVVWFYEKSIKEIHEYLADEAVLNTGKNRGRYQALLVNQALGGPVFILTNQFNQSLIKKRIMMMKKIKTSRMAKLKALFLLPLIAGLLLAFVNPQANSVPVSGGREITVTGTLTDHITGGALPGAIVLIKGTNNGTVADAHGNYTIKIADDQAVLVFSKVGYKTMEIPVANNTMINVQMDEDAMVVDFNKETNVNAKPGDVQAKAASDKGLYVVTEELPSYAGGPEALMKFLNTNIRYPEDAKKAGIEGKVYVNFVVNEKGQISNAKIMRSVSPLLNAEALRLTNLMKDWKPATHNGETLSMAVTMPIEFKIK